MPTLPLYTPSASPDAWHQVMAPGGYETWSFDAQDTATDTRLVATLSEGSVFNPQYLRKYFAYRRWPTRCRPPIPAEFPCACIAMYRGGKLRARFTKQYPAADFEGSVDSLSIRIGLNRMTRDASGDYSLHLEGSPSAGGSLQADLRFRPRFNHPAHERMVPSRQMTGSQHHWILAAPLCEASGSIRLGPAAGAATEEITVNGRGYHDHHFGTGPIVPGVRRSLRGRVLFEDRAMMFQVAQPWSRDLPGEAHLVEVNKAGVSEATEELFRIVGERRWGLGLCSPREIHFGARLKLTDPRPLEILAFCLRMVYTARVSDGNSGVAFCEIAYPHRLCWPILGRIIREYG